MPEAWTSLLPLEMSALLEILALLLHSVSGTGVGCPGVQPASLVLQLALWFSDSECARRALEQLNGFELAGRPMRVGHVTERLDGSTDITFPDGDQELDLGSAGGRLQLMAKLAEGSGIQLPTTAAAAAAQAAALQLNGAVPLGALNPAALTALSPALNLASQAIASQCFQLSSLFTPQTM